GRDEYPPFDGNPICKLLQPPPHEPPCHRPCEQVGDDHQHQKVCIQKGQDLVNARPQGLTDADLLCALFNRECRKTEKAKACNEYGNTCKQCEKQTHLAFRTAFMQEVFLYKGVVKGRPARIFAEDCPYGFYFPLRVARCNADGHFPSGYICKKEGDGAYGILQGLEMEVTDDPYNISHSDAWPCVIGNYTFHPFDVKISCSRLVENDGKRVVGEFPGEIAPAHQGVSHGLEMIMVHFVYIDQKITRCSFGPYKR